MNYRACHSAGSYTYVGAGDLVKLNRAGDRPLQLLVFDKEFLMSTSYQFALTICSRPLYTLLVAILMIEWLSEIF